VVCQRTSASHGRRQFISIVPGDLRSPQCEPERQSRDENLLAALTQVTNWRRNGELIELLGATPLRFRLMTN